MKNLTSRLLFLVALAASCQHNEKDNIIAPMSAVRGDTTRVEKNIGRRSSEGTALNVRLGTLYEQKNAWPYSARACYINSPIPTGCIYVPDHQPLITLDDIIDRNHYLTAL